MKRPAGRRATAAASSARQSASATASASSSCAGGSASSSSCVAAPASLRIGKPAAHRNWKGTAISARPSLRGAAASPISSRCEQSPAARSAASAKKAGRDERGCFDSSSPLARKSARTSNSSCADTKVNGVHTNGSAAAAASSPSARKEAARGASVKASPAATSTSPSARKAASGASAKASPVAASSSPSAQKACAASANKFASPAAASASPGARKAGSSDAAGIETPVASAAAPAAAPAAAAAPGEGEPVCSDTAPEPLYTFWPIAILAAQAASPTPRQDSGCTATSPPFAQRGTSPRPCGNDVPQLCRTPQQRGSASPLSHRLGEQGSPTHRLSWKSGLSPKQGSGSPSSASAPVGIGSGDEARRPAAAQANGCDRPAQLVAEHDATLWWHARNGTFWKQTASLRARLQADGVYADLCACAAPSCTLHIAADAAAPGASSSQCGLQPCQAGCVFWPVEPVHQCGVSGSSCEESAEGGAAKRKHGE